MKVVNPATEEVIGDYPPNSMAEIEGKLAASADAFETWRRVAVEERCRLLGRLAGVLRGRQVEWAGVMAREMGKPVTAGMAEIGKCAGACEYFSQNASQMLGPRALAAGDSRAYCRFEALGPILAIMPWNFPFWQLFRFGAAALAAGNVIVLKHAPNVPGCAMAMEEAFGQAEFPPGVFVSVRVEDNAIAQKLCGHPRIAAITLTGSERAGSAAAATAGAAIKKSVLELGGSDPFIVLKDADIQATAAAAAESRCINSGQSCIAAKRFVVEKAVLEPFLDAFMAAMEKRTLGDPLDAATDMGPLARLDLLQALQRQVEESVAAGAKVAIGGKRAGNVGYFYPPTILTGVRPGMAAFDQETFGPVAAVIVAADAEEAIGLANASSFGLGASIWTRDSADAEGIAARLEVGNVFINSIVRSDPRLPFGGVKKSGFGRELGEAGLKEFTNVKTVWIHQA